MPVARIAKAIFKKKPKSGKPISENKKKANELLRKADRIMGQAMKPEMKIAKKEQAEALRAKANKLLMNEKVGGAIKKFKEAVVKRGRKSKRGRPKKEEVEKARKRFKKEQPTTPKRTRDARDIRVKKLSGESDAAFKKRRTSINKLKKEQQKEMAKERGTKEPSTKDRTSRSMTIPLKRKEQSKASFRRRVMQGLQGVTKKGESKDIGKAGYPVSETMRELGYTGSRKAKVDLTDKELEALGFQIKKAGGMLKSIPTKNKGLSKLPKPVRNQMGFKKYGGKINNSKGLSSSEIDSLLDKYMPKEKPLTKIEKGKLKAKGGIKFMQQLGGFNLNNRTKKKITKRAIGGGVALRGLGVTRKK